MRALTSSIGALLILLSVLSSTEGQNLPSRTIRRTPYGTRSRPSERNPKFLVGSIYPTFDSRKQEKDPSSSNWSHFFVMHNQDPERGTKPKGFYYEVGDDDDSTGFMPINSDFEPKFASNPNGFFQRPVPQQPNRRFREPLRRVPPPPRSEPLISAPANRGPNDFGSHPGQFGSRLPFGQHHHHGPPGYGFPVVPPPGGPGVPDAAASNGPEREDNGSPGNGPNEPPSNSSSPSNETSPSGPPSRPAYDESPFIPFQPGPYDSRRLQPFVHRRPLPFSGPQSSFYPPPPPYGYRDPQASNDSSTAVFSSDRPLQPPVTIESPFRHPPSYFGRSRPPFGYNPVTGNSTGNSSSSPELISPVPPSGIFEPLPPFQPFPSYNRGQWGQGDNETQRNITGPSTGFYPGIHPQFYGDRGPNYPYGPVPFDSRIPPAFRNSSNGNGIRPPSPAFTQPRQFQPQGLPNPYPYQRQSFQPHNGNFPYGPFSSNNNGHFPNGQLQPPLQQRQAAPFPSPQQRVEPQYGVIDTHVQLPPLRFRFHIAPANDHPVPNGTNGLQRLTAQEEPRGNAFLQRNHYEPQRLRPPHNGPLVQGHIHRQNFLLVRVAPVDQVATKEDTTTTSSPSTRGSTSSRLEETSAEVISTKEVERSANVKDDQSTKDTPGNTENTTPLSTVTSVVTSTKTELSNAPTDAESNPQSPSLTSTTVVLKAEEGSAETTGTATGMQSETTVQFNSETTAQVSSKTTVDIRSETTEEKSSETVGDATVSQSSTTDVKETTVELNSETKAESSTDTTVTQTDEQTKSTSSVLPSVSDDGIVSMTGTGPFGMVTDPEHSLTMLHKISHQTGISS